MIKKGDDLADILIDRVRALKIDVQAGDIFVVAQKVVSKAEGRERRLSDVTPGKESKQLAEATGKDPRLVELVLSEASHVVRAVPGVLIVKHRLGLVLANAGIDFSNVEQKAGDDRALLLPVDPDGTAHELRRRLIAAFSVPVGVIINDSIGRAWRLGTVGVAIGAAGVEALKDCRQSKDMFGRPLQTTEIGFADEIASAASLVQGQSDEATPIALVKGFMPAATDSCAARLVRPEDQDLFT